MRIFVNYQILLSFIFTFSIGFSGFICMAQDRDLQWNGLEGGGLNGLNGRVDALFSDGDDLYVGGEFFNAGGFENAHHIARWDGTAWHALGNSPLSASVYAIDKYGTDLYIGGAFAMSVNDSIAQNIARWDGEAWHAVGAGGNIFNFPVWALAVFQDHLYIGGQFTNVAGIADGDHIIRWDGEQFSTVGGGITLANGDFMGVQTMVADDQNLYIGGNFEHVGNVPNTRNIARWDGTNWHALGEGFDGDFGVLDIALKQQEVYAGGDGGPIGTTACGIARWDGNEWHPMGNGLSHCTYYQGAHDIEVAGDSIFVGGIFSDAGIDHTSCFAGWNGSEWFALGDPATEPYLIPYQGGAISAIQSHGRDLYIGGILSLPDGDGWMYNIARWGESNTTSISPPLNTQTLSIEVFPNQTQGTFRYSIGNEERLHTMSIHDAWGRELIRKTQSETQGSLESVPPGFYILRVEMNGISGMARIVKI